MIKVLNEKGLVRDPYTKALLNVDNSSLNEHRKKKQLFQQLQSNNQTIEHINDDIDNLKKEMSDIKSMLLLLINKQSSPE